MQIKTRKFKNKDLTRLVKQAVRFYANALFPDIKDLIYLEIKSNKIKADGYCAPLDKYDFEIEVNQDLNFEHLMITLAHEMVHVKQYATKELKSKFVRGKPVDTWRGVKYRNLEYHNQPWEVEATTKEQELYCDFLFFALLTDILDFDKIKQINMTKENYAI